MRTTSYGRALTTVWELLTNIAVGLCSAAMQMREIEDAGSVIDINAMAALGPSASRGSP